MITLPVNALFTQQEHLLSNVCLARSQSCFGRVSRLELSNFYTEQKAASLKCLCIMQNSYIPIIIIFCTQVVLSFFYQVISAETVGIGQGATVIVWPSAASWCIGGKMVHISLIQMPQTHLQNQ